MVPHVKEGMSWLSPKRRRTTGNLKTVTNGETTNGTSPATPRASSPQARTPGAERLLTTPTPRLLSQPVLGSDAPLSPGLENEGNLFYAYARRGNDLQSRYLLTFASASIANEWWSLLQNNFPETSRPGPQLFSFKDPSDLLSKTWKHPAFAHLKSKWMYISFSDTKENGLGGAAQGIIPVQDAQGNMMAGSGLAPASPELIGQQVGPQVRKETKSVRKDMTKMEEHFERMMGAVERNTAQIAALAERQHEQVTAPKDEERNGYIETNHLASYLGRINELLAQHSENVEGLAKKQSETDQKLWSALEDVASRQRNDYLDMSQLSSHLERVQRLMEESVSERKDSAKKFADQQQLQARPAQIDFSPLMDRLGKVQEAVEQNSALVKALLDEGSAPDSKPGTPFWGKDTVQQLPQQTVDMSPLADHLQKIHEAIEQQSAHMQALVGFASGDGEATPSGGPTAAAVTVSGPGDTTEKSLAPLGEHLEQISNAIEEGNAYAKSVGRVSLEPLMEKMEAVRKAVEEAGREHAERLVERMEAARVAVEAVGKDTDWSPLERHFGGLAEHVKIIGAASERSSQQMGDLLEAHGKLKDAVIDNGKAPAPTVNLVPLIEKMEDMRAAVETTLSVDIMPMAEKFDNLLEQLQTIGNSSRKGNEQMGEMLDAHGKLRDAVVESKTMPLSLEPLVEKMAGVRAAVEANAGVDLAPLLEKFEELGTHLGSISSSSEQQNEALQELLQAQDGLKGVVLEGAKPPDFGPLTHSLDGVLEHLESIGTLSQRHNDSLQQLLQAQDGLRSAVFESRQSPPDFTPLTEKFSGLSEHLESLREWAEYDSEQLKDLVESQKATRAAAEAGNSIDLAPLTSKFDCLGEHLGAIRTANKDHTESVRSLLETYQSASHQTPAEIDLTPLTDRLNRIHESLQRQAERGDKSPGIGDAKFIMSALSSHLSKIQAVTEANAQHVRALREKQSATQEKMHISVASTSDAIAALNQHASAQQDRTDQRVEALNGQVRELMAGQREMVEVMRELAKSITAQNKGACDHVVVPPPRKVGRKIVGFVYDAKDGPVKPQAKTEGEDYWKGL